MPSDLTHECAALVMDTIPIIMRNIMADMPGRKPSNLTVRQFHALMFVNHHEGASLTMVAEHLGTTLSSTSKLVDGLVERGYAKRETATEDRRRMILAITATGKATLDIFHQAAIGCLARNLTCLSDDERSAIECAMKLLQSVFNPSRIKKSRIENTLKESMR